MDTPESVKTPQQRVSPREKHERDRENLRRLGCCMILYSYEELRRWCRPKTEYAKKQLRVVERGEDPLAELYQFFFGEDGMDEVIEAFEIKLTPDIVRRAIKPVFAQARAHMEGRTPEITEGPSEADWDLLLEAMGGRIEDTSPAASEGAAEEEAL